MSFRIIFIVHFLFLLATTIRAEATPFLEEYPQLEGYSFTEPKSKFHLGMGIAPVNFLKSKVYSSFSVFQLYYMNEKIDFEIFNVSVGLTLTGGSDLQSQHFVIRTSPKWRLMRSLSIGPLGGIESVRFPKQQSRQYKAPWATKEEPFSNTGLIYGLMVSETFDYKKDELFKMNQVIYYQTYSVEKTYKNWEYFFADPSVDANRKPIEPGLVLMFEFAILY